MTARPVASADVVFVGGGISGHAGAAAAARRGARVALIEKESEPAREGSGRAQGSLRLQGRHAAEFPLARESIELWKQLGEDVDCEYGAGRDIREILRGRQMKGLWWLAHKPVQLVGSAASASTSWTITSRVSARGWR